MVSHRSNSQASHSKFIQNLNGVDPIHDEHDNGVLARSYPLFLFFTVFVLLLGIVV